MLVALVRRHAGKQFLFSNILAAIGRRRDFFRGQSAGVETGLVDLDIEIFVARPLRYGLPYGLPSRYMVVVPSSV